MHGVIFSFSVGTSLGPLLAAPFLGTKPQISAAFSQGSTGITILYPLTGCLVLASGLSFLALALKGSPAAPKTEKRIEAEQTRKVTSKFKKPFFVALMCAFLFLYVGAEIALGAYLTLFCVRSSVCKVWRKAEASCTDYTATHQLVGRDFVCLLFELAS